jgi:hypothetical protein
MTRDELLELAVVKTAQPCPKKWSEMQGNDVKRFCGDCRLNVYNLSSLTTLEAWQLLRAGEGRTCMRLYTRADGTVLTRDCPTGLRLARRKVVRSALAAAAMVAAAIAFVLQSLVDLAPAPIAGVVASSARTVTASAVTLTQQVGVVAQPMPVLRSENPPHSTMAGGMRAQPVMPVPTARR